ncbi:MAG: arsenosugar biosynthesis radical SAM (seleno)protein ArsS [Cyanobium sp.]
MTSALAPTPFPAIRRGSLATLQVNLGYRCNQSCSHCHVGASPTRVEMMEPATLELIPRVLQARGIGCLDITGGAPELHPGFRALVQAGREAGATVIDRCNLTILSEPGQADLASFLAGQRVTVVASLPCYLRDNVDRQRGDGVFERSIAALRQLNGLGYGQAGSGLELYLVYNPQGPVLPPPQAALEADYRRVLASDYGVEFSGLYALANMPIQRFEAVLRATGQLDDYLELLRRQHRPANLEAVMCRQLISVDWRGHLHDCDFNQMLDLGLSRVDLGAAAGSAGGLAAGDRAHLRDLLRLDPAGAAVRVADHCWGCTAGGGSSCGGSLS